MSGTAADFPGRYPVLIGTRAFAVNTSYEQFRRQSFHHDTIPSQRESINLNDVPGEGTINTEGLWRRGQITWHHGAGQLYLDRKESDDARFLYSFGVDPWTENQLTLLPDTIQRVSDAATYNWCTTEVTGSYVYHLQGNSPPVGGVARVRYTTDYVTWTVPTGLPATNIFAIATDGINVYAAGAGGVYVVGVGGSSTGGSVGAAWLKIINDACDHVYCVADRVIITVNNAVWDISAGMTPGTGQALNAGNAYNVWNHPNASWNWLDFEATSAAVYGVGVVGHPAGQVGESNIYQFVIPSNNTVNLSTGTVAYPMAAGEFGGTLRFYEDLMYCGTNLGIRTMKTISPYDPAGAAGALVSGPLQPNLTQPIQAPLQPYVGNFVSGIVGYNKWVYFSWPQYVDPQTGTMYWAVGRLDPTQMNAPLQPAYAPDLMVASTNNSVDSHHTLNWDPVTNGPLIIVPSQGLYTQDFDSTYAGAVKYVTSGYLRSGRITYGISDMKTVAQANFRAAAVNAVFPHDVTAGTITLDVAYEEGSFASLAPLAPNTQANPPILITPLTPAEEIETMAILNSGTLGGNAHGGRPFLTRYTIKSLPNVVSGIYIYICVMLYTDNDIEGSLDFSDPYGDYAYLENLRLSQQIITYKEGSAASGATQFTATCVVNELYWMPDKKRDNADGGYEGDLVVTLKSIVG